MINSEFIETNFSWYLKVASFRRVKRIRNVNFLIDIN